MYAREYANIKIKHEKTVFFAILNNTVR